MNSQFICNGLNVNSLREKLITHPEWFDGIDYRKLPKGKMLSPHRECSDIHVRYNDMKNSNRKDFHTAKHVPVWYEIAKEIPEAIGLAMEIMKITCSEMLGSVYIFKLEPGKKVYPHKDNSWNSVYYDKFCIGIQGGEGGIVRFEDNTCFEPKEGEVYRFENSVTHSVTNFTDKDWICMVVNCRPVNKGYSEDLCQAH